MTVRRSSPRVIATMVMTLVLALLAGVTQAIAVVPTAPTGLTVATGNGYAQVSFTAAGNAPTNYKYALSTDGTNFTTPVALSPADATSPIYIPGLVNGTTYYVKLLGTNVDGDGLVSAASAAFQVKPNSQITSAQAFLMGQYAEVGVRANGAFGSTTVPSGFHSNVAGCLGFRVDRDKDGWATTANTDDGDFFCPGSPYEGWQLKVGSAGTARNNCDTATAIPGAVSGISLSGGKQSVNWASTSATDGISVSQVATVPDSEQVLHVDITLTNSTASALTNIYYGRSFDPDNATGPGTFVSTNTVQSVSSPAKVTSTWTNGSFISLYSPDSRARAARRDSGFGCTEDPINIFSATTTTNAGGWTSTTTPNTNDSGTGIAVKIDSLAAGASTTFRISYVLTDNAANLPGAPTINSVTPGDGSLSVNLTAGTGTVTNYEYSLDGGITWQTRSPVSTASPLVISGLTNGTQYNVAVRALNSYGTGYASSSVTATPIGPPGSPTITSIDTGVRTLAVHFTPGTSGGSPITNYAYALSTDGGATWGTYTALSPASTSTTINIATLVDATSYTVKIRAINSVTNGADSNAMGTSTAGPPGRPTITSITTGDSRVYVNFNLGSTGGSAITNVEYSTNNGISWDVRTPASLTSPLLITGLTNGTTYPIAIRAVNAVGAGLSSVSVDARPSTVPGAPSYTGDVRTSSGLISLVITAPSDGGSPILMYQYSTDRGGTWINRTDARTTETNLDISALSSDGVSSLVNGTEYCIQIRAVNANGAGAASADTCATPATIPDTPTIISVDSRASALLVSFVNGGNGGSPITSVEYSNDGGTTWANSGVVSGSFLISGLTNGSGYPVKIRAVNAIGNSLPSSAVSGTPLATPAAPIISVVTPSSTKLTVEYALGSSNGSSISTVEYSLDAGVTWTTPSPTTTSSPLVISGLTNNTTYHLQLRAVNGVGAGAPTPSAIASTPRLIADAPVISTITGGNGTLSVAFTPGSDNGSAITNYEFTTDGGATWLARTPAATTSPLLISGLTNGTTYSVRLRAINGAGSGAQSAAVSGIPFKSPDAPTISSITAGNASLVVAFNPGANNGSAITGYQYSIDGGGSWVTPGTPVTYSPLTISGLTNGTTYYVQVRAVNAAGAGAASSTFSGAPSASAGDVTPPTFVSAAVPSTGNTIVLTYNEALSSTTAPASAFAVTVNGSSATITSVTVSGSTVVLSMASTIGTGQTVTVTYTDPTAGNDANAVQDIAGNDASSLGATSVTNNSTLDLTPPTFVSAAVTSSGTTLELTYKEALSATTAPASAFAVTVDARSAAISSVGISGSKVVLTLSSTVGVGQAVSVSYADPTAGNDANAVQDIALNDAASLASTSVTNGSTQDLTPPVFVSAAVTSSGTTLELTYNEALSATTAPLSAFVVSIDARSVAISSVGISGSKVVLTLSSTVGVGQTVSVSYVDPTAGNDTSAVQDIAGNDASTLASTSVTNNSTADITPPTFVSAAVTSTGTTLELTYNEALSATTAPSSAFAVTVDARAVQVSSATISGHKVLLSLVGVIGAGSVVAVSYADPTAGNDASAVQDLAGNDATSLAQTTVTNGSSVDLTPPVFISAQVTVSGTTLELTYSESLSAITASTSAFVVTVDTRTALVTGVSTSGSKVILTLANLIGVGQAVALSYLDPTSGNDTSAIQDLVGNDAANLSSVTVLNSSNADITPPALLSATVPTLGTTLILHFDETLSSLTAGTDAFAVTVDARSVTITSVSASGSNVVLSLALPIGIGAVVSLSYADPTSGNDLNAIQDSSGNDAVTLVSITVTNNSSLDLVPPQLLSAEIDVAGTSILLTFSEPLSNSAPLTGDFRIDRSGTALSVVSLLVSGSTISIAIDGQIFRSEIVSLTYTDPSVADDAYAVQDLAGNDAATITSYQIFNRSSVTPPSSGGGGVVVPPIPPVPSDGGSSGGSTGGASGGSTVPITPIDPPALTTILVKPASTVNALVATWTYLGEAAKYQVTVTSSLGFSLTIITTDPSLHVLGMRGVTYKFSVVAVAGDGTKSEPLTTSYSVPKSAAPKAVAVLKVSTTKSIGNSIRRLVAKYAGKFKPGDSVLCQADSVGPKYLKLAKLRAAQLCRTLQKRVPTVWTKYAAGLTTKRIKFNRPRIRVSVLIVLRSLPVA